MIVRKEGGVSRRPGSRFIAETKDHERRSRLINFKFSTTQAYIIEAGAGYFRFYKDKAQIISGLAAYEVASPYTEQQALEMTWTQSFDVLYIDHAEHPPRTLTRTDHTAWILADVPFSPAMTYEAGISPLGNLGLSALTGTITLTTEAGVFLNSDLDRLVEALGGQATIIGLTSSTQATAQVNRPFSKLTFPTGEWRLVGSPVAQVTPDKKEPVGAVVTLTASTSAWRASDVGKYVDIAGGFVQIIGYTSPTVVTGIIRATLSATTAVGAGGWKLRSPSWSPDRGYPVASGFHQQRLAFVGAPADPGRAALSRSADFYNFAFGTSDDDAIEYPLLDDDVNAAVWVKSFGQALAIGTDSGVWVLSSGINDPTITPTAVTASMEAPYGAAGGFLARRIAGAVVYVHRSRKSLRALRYSATREGYDAEDLNVLSAHMLNPGIVDWTFQEEREPTLWVVRADGQLAGCTWYPEHQVMGWHRHITDGVVESVAVIPGDPDDEMWMIVRRTIGGQTRRFVECLDPRFDLDGDIRDAFFVDCGLSYRGAPATVISGLGHLEGETVQVLADGMVLPEQPVVDGDITLDEPASIVHVGLGYVGRLSPIVPDVGAADGTTFGRQRRIVRVVADGLRATQFWVGPDAGHMVKVDDVVTRRLDQPADMFTGEARVLPDTGYDDRYSITLEHRLPAPFELRALAFLLESSQS